MRRFGNLRERIFEFESSDSFLANRFLMILDQMKFAIVEKNIVSNYIGSSTIKFMATPERRLQLEYIFRRISCMERLYLLDLTSYQRNQWKYRNDHYMIY